MQGEGHVKDWLVQTGKDIGNVAGAHLKKAAKDKAVSYAQEMLGKGIADELGAAAKSVGASALGAAAENVGGIKDKESAKAAAKNVGKAAASTGAKALSSLADKYFGGAGTPQQAVKVCAYTLGSLRKLVTAYRRDLSKLSVNEYLRLHAKRAIEVDKDYKKKLAEFLEKIGKSPRKGGHSMKKKRRLVAVIRKQLHPPVSKMTRLQICQYVYGTTKEMDVDWTPYFEKAVQRKRIPKGCFEMPGPGSDDYAEPKTKKKRASTSAYNQFVKDKMANEQFQKRQRGATPRQKMQSIARDWKDHKADLADKAAQKQRAKDYTRLEDEEMAPRRAAMKRAGPIPKKKKTT